MMCAQERKVIVLWLMREFGRWLWNRPQNVKTIIHSDWIPVFAEPETWKKKKKKPREALPKKQLTEVLPHSHTNTHMHSNMPHGKLNRHVYDLLASQGSALRVYDIYTDHRVAIIERNPMKAHWTKLPIQHARCMRQQIPCTVWEIYNSNGALHFIDTLTMTEFGHYRSCAKFHSLPLYRNFKGGSVLRKM